MTRYRCDEIKNGGHTLDTAAARVTTWKALERFLGQNLGHAGQEPGQCP